MGTVNKVCQKCRKNCKQRPDCEIIYCPMFERVKEKPDIARKVADVREVVLEVK
jgi:hypothetical protein